VLYCTISVNVRTSATSPEDAASISITSRLLPPNTAEHDGQCPQGPTGCFSQFNPAATILPVVVLPAPRTPVNSSPEGTVRSDTIFDSTVRTTG